MIALLLALVLGGPLAEAQATSLDDIFREVNEAYYAGDHDAAARAYERLVELGVDDADVYFNLGAAYARDGRHGRAVAAFERALACRPGDAGARAALDASRAALGRAIAEREGEAVVETGPTMGEAIFGGIDESVFAIGLLVALALLFGGMSGRLYATGESARVGLALVISIAGLAALVLALGLAVRTGAFDPGEAAVVVATRGELREGPSAAAAVRHPTREGERAYVLDRERGWSHVILSGGREGWLADDDVVVVR